MKLNAFVPLRCVAIRPLFMRYIEPVLLITALLASLVHGFPTLSRFSAEFAR